MDQGNSNEYVVNWKNYMNHVKQAFDNLLVNNDFVDVTLCCEGKKIGAHKILLSACSEYFYKIFKDVPCQHPIIILNGVEFSVLTHLLHFIYNGEVSVEREKLDSFLKTAQLLQISGLVDTIFNDDVDENQLNKCETLTQEHESKPSVSLLNEETIPKKPLKRNISKDTPQPNNNKQIRVEPENVILSNIKCEPTDMSIFDVNVDPLTPDVNRETPATNSQNTTEEEFTKQTDTKMKLSHFSEESLRCMICQKVFSHPYSLLHHKAVHSGGTRCPICHAILSRKYNLKMHMKARHNV